MPLGMDKHNHGHASPSSARAAEGAAAGAREAGDGAAARGARLGAQRGRPVARGGQHVLCQRRRAHVRQLRAAPQQARQLLPRASARPQPRRQTPPRCASHAPAPGCSLARSYGCLRQTLNAAASAPLLD